MTLFKLSSLLLKIVCVTLLAQNALAGPKNKKASPSGLMLRATPEMRVIPKRGSRSAFVPPLKGVDATLVFAEWNDLQPKCFGPIAEDNVIDRAIKTLEAWNLRYPEDQVMLRLRCFAGIYSPDWVMQHAGSVDVDYRKKESDKAVIRQTPRFWTKDFADAWLDLQRKLAKKYDQHPLIADVSISGCMTLHSEVMWRQPGFPFVTKTLEQAGLSRDKDLACLKRDITMMMQTWSDTPLEMTMNSRRVQRQDVRKRNKSKPDIDFSVALLDHLRQQSAAHGNKSYMIGNHSLSHYSAIKNHLWKSPGHIFYQLLRERQQYDTGLYFQTEVFSASEVSELVDAALWMGAKLIELPNDITKKQILDPRLQAQRRRLKGELVCDCTPHKTSKLWLKYMDARKKRQETPVIDFSYAGYRRGMTGTPSHFSAVKTFDVRDFGAVADDSKSDKVAIQKAIDAAAATGGGVIRFPKGRFLINQPEDDQSMLLQIRAGNIVLQGAGSGAGGTELFMHQHLEAKDPKKMWTTPYLIEVKAPYHKPKKLATITKVSQRDSMEVGVDHTTGIQVGDWVVLRRRDTSDKAVRMALAPYEPDPQWTSIIAKGVHIAEFHQVRKVTDESLSFYEPVHCPLAPDAGWTIESHRPIAHVGIQDLAFVGNWKESFVHHKSAVHDGGWSLLQFSNIVNGWVRRCRFTDVNNAFTANRCSNISALEITIDGNKGHTAVAFRNSSHCLGALIDDTASQHHACGVGGMSSGNVFWRISYPSDTSYEAHASQPRHTLFDQVIGGFVDGRWGGSAANQPNHLEGLILWNYHNTSQDSKTPYEFVKTKKKYGKIIMPQVIGFHGGEVDFVAKQIKYLESSGQAVSPPSLYQAQLQHRLGRLPEWLDELN